MQQRPPATQFTPSCRASASGRSTKAGALAPATPHGVAVIALAVLRSTKAGALAPATRHDRPTRHPCCAVRSTKAGALAPATQPLDWLLQPAAEPLNEGRSVSSGDTRRKGSIPTATPGRSTKAGALAPATLSPRRRWHRGPWPLNEGRSVSSGDTATGWERVSLDAHAQRRPER